MQQAIFVDGSVNPQTRIGCGAFLAVPVPSSLQPPTGVPDAIKTKRFTNTSSTQLELETLLWALSDVERGSDVTVYTDCQNIMGLLARRNRLESKNYCNAKGQALAHAALYQRFFQCYDALAFTLVKLKGHKPAANRSVLDQWFSLVDRAARAACLQKQ